MAPFGLCPEAYLECREHALSRSTPAVQNQVPSLVADQWDILIIYPDLPLYLCWLAQ